MRFVEIREKNIAMKVVLYDCFSKDMKKGMVEMSKKLMALSKKTDSVQKELKKVYDAYLREHPNMKSVFTKELNYTLEGNQLDTQFAREDDEAMMKRLSTLEMRGTINAITSNYVTATSKYIEATKQLEEFSDLSNVEPKQVLNAYLYALTNHNNVSNYLQSLKQAMIKTDKIASFIKMKEEPNREEVLKAKKESMQEEVEIQNATVKPNKSTRKSIQENGR